MASKECENCGEMADDAKAFCPGCGHAFVEEKVRETKSNFDTADHTMQLGQTMYNQMLSDMGLNISRAPDSVDKKIEVIAPVAVEPKPPLVAKPSSKKKWIIAAVAIGLVAALLAIAVSGIVIIYWYQYR